MLVLMLGSQARARSRSRVSGRDQGMGLPQTGYHIAFARDIAGVSMVRPRAVLRPAGAALQGRFAGAGPCRGWAGGRDIWQLLKAASCCALRIELDSPNIVIARLGPTKFALASEIVLGGETLRGIDADAERLARRQAGDTPGGSVTLQNWNPRCRNSSCMTSTWILRRVRCGLLAASFSARLPPVLGGHLSFTGSLTAAAGWTGSNGARSRERRRHLVSRLAPAAAGISEPARRRDGCIPNDGARHGRDARRARISISARRVW